LLALQGCDHGAVAGVKRMMPPLENDTYDVAAGQFGE
jgi:hypothetical protein